MSSVGKAGLEDVVVSTSEICFIDGREGRLLYRGYDVDDLVEQSTFEEVVFLLWHGPLPSKKELAAHTKALSSTAAARFPPSLAMLRQLPKKTTPMEVLRTGVSALSSFDPDAADNSREASVRKAIRLTAQMPTLVAAWERIRRGKPPVAPNPQLSLAANFLYMLTGKKPTDLAAKTFDVALILHADHEFNASTFAARVTAATLSDMHSAIVVRHRRAQGPAARRRQRAGHADGREDPDARATRSRASARTSRTRLRIMGFGHRVYRVEDPRAKHLRRLAFELGQQTGDTSKAEIINTVAPRGHRGEEDLPERRPLLGRGVPVDGHPHRPVHADLRHEPGRRLGRPRARAARATTGSSGRAPSTRATAASVRSARPPLSSAEGPIDGPALRSGSASSGARFAADLHAVNHRPLRWPRLSCRRSARAPASRPATFARLHEIQPATFALPPARRESRPVERRATSCATTDVHRAIAIAA